MTTTPARQDIRLHDADLLSLLPDIREIVGSPADRGLWTFGEVSRAGLPQPSVWNLQPYGFEAFYGLTKRPEVWLPAGYVTERPMVSATWLNVLRSAWMWNLQVSVDQVVIWRANTPAMLDLFQRLLFHVRDWYPRPDDEVDRMRLRLSQSIRQATEALTCIPHWG